MERNTFLAIALSIVVLFAYQAIFVAPKEAQLLKNTQNTATNSVTKTNSETPLLNTNTSQETTNIVKKTIDYELNNQKTGTSYTNVGGTLHKIEFSEDKIFPITDVLSINGFENAQYTGQRLNEKTVLLAYKDKNWQITKKFEIKDNNLIKVRMEIKNLSEISILNNLTFKSFQIDESRMEIIQNNRQNGLQEYSVYSNNKLFRKDNAYKFTEKEYKSEPAAVNWVGFRDHYYAFILKPEFDTKAYEIKTDNDQQLNVFIKPQDKNLAPGETVAYDFTIYLGPQDPWLMKKYGMNFEKIVVFSKYFIYELPAEAIYHTIPFLHSIFKSWGVSIILIGILFYTLSYPLTMQTMMSMRKMQEVQPKIKALQERYKNDPQKLNIEMVEIYRREKINPLGGCLPTIIQMPFYYAIFQVMWRAQYFQGQGFLWIKDLSQPDHLMILPFYLPFVGNELNILPVLTGCLMFLQQTLSSKSMVVTDEQQAMQQKMMMYLMPTMMVFFFYKFTSGWGIYFVTYYLFSTLAQWKLAQTTAKKTAQ